MSNLKALLRLELKARFSGKGASKKSLALKYGLTVVFGGIIYAGYCYLLYSLIGMFHAYDYDYSALQLFTLTAFSVLVGFGTSSVIKNLFHSGDDELLLRFPVNSLSIFTCKTIVLTITQAIGSFLLTAPAFIIYGVETNRPVGYYFASVLVYALLLAISLSLSILLAIPTMMVASKFKHKHLLTLIFNIVLVGGAFALYMALINGVVQFARDESLSFFSRDSMAYIANIKYVYPISLYADVLAGKTAQNPLWLAYVGSVVTTALFAWFAFYFCQKFYLKIVLNNIESEGASFTRKSSNYVSKPLFAVLKREWRDIFRSSNYSFQYLVMALAAPIMVYSCNKLAGTVAANNLDVITKPMVTMLVMLIFVTITVSFAGSCISREGGSFYLTKVSPVPVGRQVLVKTGLYVFVGVISIVLSLSVVMITKNLSVKDGFIIMANCILFAFALTCFAVRLDIAKPQFPVGGEGEVINGTFATFAALLVGFALSIAEGIFGLVGFVIWYPPFTYGMLALINGVLAIAAVLWLVIKLPHYYNNIVQR